MDKLRTVIAEKDLQFRRQLKEILIKADHVVVGEAEDGMSALRLIQSIEPELVLISFDLAGSSGLELAMTVEENRLAAVILMLEYADKDRINRGECFASIPVVIKPFDEFNLLAVIDYAYSAYNRVNELEHEVNRLKNDLQTRKTVEKEKGILMKDLGIGEEDAFKRIQQQSMKKRTSMKQIAEAIILSYEVSR